MFCPIQPPPCNGAAVSEYRLEWGAAEGSMQMCYTGAALSHEMRGLLPATCYFCRVQVRTLISSQCLSWWWDMICHFETNQEIAVWWLIVLLLPVSTLNQLDSYKWNDGTSANFTFSVPPSGWEMNTVVVFLLLLFFCGVYNSCYYYIGGYYILIVGWNFVQLNKFATLCNYITQYAHSLNNSYQIYKRKIVQYHFS